MGRHKTAGYYGLAWMDFMEENHPDLVADEGKWDIRRSGMVGQLPRS